MGNDKFNRGSKKNEGRGLIVLTSHDKYDSLIQTKEELKKEIIETSKLITAITKKIKKIQMSL